MSKLSIKEAADDFLSQKRIAVVGVSRETDGGHGGNSVYNRLKERGYETFAVNPTAEQVEGDRAYHSLADIPGGVDAVVVATHPSVTASVVQQCVDLGIDRVWIHRAIGPGSMSAEAAKLGREQGITVIAGGCPLMFEPCSDGGHRFMRRVLTLTGAVPRRV
jgi:predicted CoA-binding protein